MLKLTWNQNLNSKCFSIETFADNESRSNVTLFSLNDHYFVLACCATASRRNRQMGRREQFNREGGQGNGATNAADSQIRSTKTQTSGTMSGLVNPCH